MSEEQISAGKNPMVLKKREAVHLETNENENVISSDVAIYETKVKQEKLDFLTIINSVIDTYSWEQMKQVGLIRLNNPELNGNSTVNDERLGPISLDVVCKYCGQLDCPGHYGLIDFGGNLIYNSISIRELLSVLICTCNSCGKLLIPKDVLEEKGFMKMPPSARLSAMETYSKGLHCTARKEPIAGGKIKPCLENPEFNTTDVKKKGEFIYNQQTSVMDDTQEGVEGAPKKKGRKSTKQQSSTHLMPIKKVWDIINTISPKDACYLGFQSYHRLFGKNKEAIWDILDNISAKKLFKLGITVSSEDGANYVPFHRLYDILDDLTPPVLESLGFKSGNHPKNMILHGLLVPPTIARPPKYENGNIHYDQLSNRYSAIIRKVQYIMNHPGAATSGTSDTLYTMVKDLTFKSDDQKKQNTPEFQSIVERIQGKTAILRGSLMGKRNDQCGRTVSGPDPTLPFGWIRLPKAWESILTKNVVVNDRNRNYLQKLFNKGHIVRFTPRDTGIRRAYNKNLRYQLKIGDIVKRYLKEGDRIVVNRQPTLHRQSMMGYKVKLGKENTIGLHLSYTTPMNNDFDGDENNAWNPQDFEVEAEVDVLLNVIHNIPSDEQNRPIMGLVMNSITGSYLLTEDHVRLSDNLFLELTDMLSNKSSLPTLYDRLMKYGIHPRSGKAIYSALFPPDFTYKRGNIVIMQGVLVQSRMNKDNVGATHRSVIQDLEKEYDSFRTADFFTDASWIINKWLMEYGFTVGILDILNPVVDPVEKNNYRILAKKLKPEIETLKKEIPKSKGTKKTKLQEQKETLERQLRVQKGKVTQDATTRILKQEITKINVQLEALGPKADDPLEEEQRQTQIRGLVNLATDIGLRIAREVLEKPSLYNELRFPPNMPNIHVNNAIGVMTVEAKTKGALANVGQILGAVGQQNYRGKPFVPTLSGGKRVLPTTDMDDDRPESRGFISSSFMSGLSPEELFLLQKGGRENLLDTALKTAETGTIQRRMSKAFETIHVSADGSVRNTIGTMFSPVYNNGYRIGNTVMVQNQDGTTVPSFMDIKAAIFHLNTKRGWVPKNVEERVEKNKNILMDDPTFKNNKEDYPMIKPEEDKKEGEDEISPNKTIKIIKKKRAPKKASINEASEAEKFETYERKYKDNTSGVRKLSRFEKARIIGTRATQLANNSAPLVEVDENEHDPVVIATKEYYAGVLELYIIRRFTDGSYQKVKPTLDNIE